MKLKFNWIHDVIVIKEILRKHNVGQHIRLQCCWRLYFIKLQIFQLKISLHFYFKDDSSNDYDFKFKSEERMSVIKR